MLNIDDNEVKSTFITKQSDENFRKMKSISTEEKAIEPINVKPIFKSIQKESSKNKNVVTINFPLIKRVPQQKEIVPRYKSFNIINKFLTPNKQITQRQIFQKILFKNKKYSLYKKNLKKIINFSESNGNNYQNNDQSKLYKNETNESIIQIKLNKKNKKNIKKYYNYKNLSDFNSSNISNISKNSNKSTNSNNSASKIKSHSINSKKHSSIKRNQIFHNSDNYLNSKFVQQILKRRKPYVKLHLSFGMIGNRLYRNSVNDTNTIDNESNSKIKLGSKYLNSIDINDFKDERLDEYKERLYNFYENEKLKNNNKENKIKYINNKMPRNEVMDIFRQKKLRICDYYIGQNAKKVNKIRNKINREYNNIIQSFHQYDDWNSPENKDNLYEK